MKEIRPNLNKLEYDLIHKLNRKLGIDFYLQKNIEIKVSFFNSIFVDCHDVLYGLVQKQFSGEVRTVSKL